MADFLSYFDFAMDIVCFMPPINEVESITVTRDQAILFAFGALGLLVVAITGAAMKEVFSGNPAIAVVMAICVSAIGFIGLDQEALKGVFLAGYPPLVIALRFGEGVIVGERTSAYLRWWHGILLLAVVVGLYQILKPLSPDTLATLKGGWAVFGVVVASFAWTRVMAGAPLFRNPFCLIAVFAVFASTLAYVSTSPFERAIYQWALPGGLLVGIIERRVSPHVPDDAPTEDT